MNRLTNFDLLLFAAADDLAIAEGEEALAIHAPDPITPQEIKRFRRILKANTRQASWTPLRIALVAILAAMSLAFAACICVPGVRSAIKDVFLTFYEDYVAVDFASSEETTEAEPHDTTEPESKSLEDVNAAPVQAELTAPERIRRKVYVKDLSEDYTATVHTETQAFYITTYSLRDKPIFMMIQSIISDESIWSNYDTEDIKHVTVHDHAGVILQQPGDASVYTVIWQDEEYRYALQGLFQNEQEALAMAERFALPD